MLPFWSTMPEVLLRPGRANWPDDLAVRDLHGGDVDRSREVDDEPVDLLVLQRLTASLFVSYTMGFVLGLIT